jgi:hypothetical protein
MAHLHWQVLFKDWLPSVPAKYVSPYFKGMGLNAVICQHVHSGIIDI